MDLVAYLTTPTSNFGGLEWAFFVLEAVVALAGVYLAFLRQDTHPIRGPALQRLGYALLALGALGVLVGALRLAALEPFTMPIWFYAVGLLEILFAAYALYYRAARYPALLAAYAQSTRSAASRRVVRPQPALETNGASVAYREPRPTVVSGRRESRRDRKRRSR